MPDTPLIEHRLLDEHAFVLVDRTNAHDDFWRGLPGIPVVSAAMKAKADAMPLLVSVDQLTQAQRATLLDRLLAMPAETPRPVAALLASHASAERIVNHLRACMVVTVPHDGPYWFRFYDPRVFRHVLWMASPSQLATLLFSIGAWTWCDAQGHWRRNHPPEGVVPMASFSIRGIDIIRITVLERCLKNLRTTVPNFIDDTDNAQARRVNALLDEATTHGLADEADLRLYVMHAIRHPGIHRHPELARRLRAVEDDDSYVGACGDLDDSTLARYALELSPPSMEHTL